MQKMQMQLNQDESLDNSYSPFATQQQKSYEPVQLEQEVELTQKLEQTQETELEGSKPNYFKKFLWGLFCIPAVPFRMAFETAVFPLKMLYDWGKTVVDTIKYAHKEVEKEKKGEKKGEKVRSVLKSVANILFLKPINYIYQLIAAPFAYLFSAGQNAVALSKGIGTDEAVPTCNKYVREEERETLFEEVENEKGKKVEVKRIAEDSFKYEQVTFGSIVKFLFGITTTNVDYVEIKKVDKKKKGAERKAEKEKFEKEAEKKAVSLLSFGKVVSRGDEVGFIRPFDFDIVSFRPKQEEDLYGQER